MERAGATIARAVAGQRDAVRMGVHVHAGDATIGHRERNAVTRRQSRGEAAIGLLEQAPRRLAECLDHQAPIFVEHAVRPAILGK